MSSCACRATASGAASSETGGAYSGKIDTLSSEVRDDNPVAQGLYRREGFIETGRRPRYYQPDDVDAIIMQLDLVGWDAARREAAGNEPTAVASGGVCT